MTKRPLLTEAEVMRRSRDGTGPRCWLMDKIPWEEPMKRKVKWVRLKDDSEVIYDKDGKVVGMVSNPPYDNRDVFSAYVGRCINEDLLGFYRDKESAKRAVEKATP